MYLLVCKSLTEGRNCTDVIVMTASYAVWIMNIRIERRGNQMQKQWGVKETKCSATHMDSEEWVTAKDNWH